VHVKFFFAEIKSGSAFRPTGIRRFTISNAQFMNKISLSML